MAQQTPSRAILFFLAIVLVASPGCGGVPQADMESGLLAGNQHAGRIVFGLDQSILDPTSRNLKPIKTIITSFDQESMKKLWSVEHPAAWCRALACTADGTLVGWYDYKTVHLLDGRSGENRLSIPFPTEHPVGDLKLIPDGTLVGLCEFCYRVTIFDTRAGQILSQWKNKEVGTLAFVSHDDLLVGGKDGHLKLWDWRRQRTRKDYDFSFGTVWSLLLHPDGKRFFALGQDGFALYNLADAKPIYEVKEDLNGVTYNCLDPESKLLAVAGKFRSPSVWDAETGKLVARLKPELGKRFTLKWGGLAFTADGKLLASRVSAPPKPAPYSVELFTFDVATQKIVATCEFPEKKP